VVVVVVTHLILQQIEMGLTVVRAEAAALRLVLLAQEQEAREIRLQQVQHKVAMVVLVLKLVVLGVLVAVVVVHHKQDLVEVKHHLRLVMVVTERHHPLQEVQ
jgi:hypothetical protein